MPPLFVFGTLCDPALAQVVVGRPVEAQTAYLPDYEAFWAHGQSFPFLAPAPGRSAEGAVLEGLTDEELARLDFYEAGFGNWRQDVAVSLGDEGMRAARAYLPKKAPLEKGAPWRVEDWNDAWGDLSREAAIEAMSYYGDITAQHLAARMPQIRQRADARRKAGSGAPPAKHSPELTAKDVEVISKSTPYANYFALEEWDLRFANFAGGMSEQVRRAVFVGGDSAVVLPYDPQRDAVLLVEQFRSGPLVRSDPHPWTLEPVAGRIDPLESAAEAAQREAQEEAGIRLTQMHLVSQHYPSPGSSTEYFTLFVGEADLGDVGTSGGLVSEEEDIRLHLLDYATFEDLLDTDQLRAGPLVLLGHWLARHRARLRAGVTSA